MRRKTRAAPAWPSASSSATRTCSPWISPRPRWSCCSSRRNSTSSSSRACRRSGRARASFRTGTRWETGSRRRSSASRAAFANTPSTSGSPELPQSRRSAAFQAGDAGFELGRFARQVLEAFDLGRALARVRDAFLERRLAARDLLLDLAELPVQVIQVAAALVAGLEARRQASGTDAAVGMAGPPLRITALVGAEGLQPFVASRDVALGIGCNGVLGAGAAVRAEALERLPARAVLEADRVPVGAQAFVLVHAGAARHEHTGESDGNKSHAEAANIRSTSAVVRTRAMRGKTRSINWA